MSCEISLLVIFSLGQLEQITDGHSRCRTDSMGGKRDLHIQRGPHHRVHNIHPMEQKGDPSPP